MYVGIGEGVPCSIVGVGGDIYEGFEFSSLRIYLPDCSLLNLHVGVYGGFVAIEGGRVGVGGSGIHKKYARGAPSCEYWASCGCHGGNYEGSVETSDLSHATSTKESNLINSRPWTC